MEGLPGALFWLSINNSPKIKKLTTFNNYLYDIAGNFPNLVTKNSAFMHYYYTLVRGNLASYIEFLRFNYLRLIYEV